MNVTESKSLEEDLDRHLRMGYRIDMITPADAPRKVQLSKNGEVVLLRSKNRQHSSNTDWTIGRAGMEYRDLIPGRMDGKVIASHIRLTRDGEVPDYVHYHKVEFQMIYCLKGRIQVVYEDQGPSFWMEAGDLVLQPPEIRHRVLFAEGNAEVIEVTSPAEHETWVEHEIDLPTSDLRPDRDFGGQRFLWSRSVDAVWELSGSTGFERRETGMDVSTGGLVNVEIFHPVNKETQTRTNAVYEADKGLTIPLNDGGSLFIEFPRDF